MLAWITDGRFILNKLPGADSSSVEALSRDVENVKLNPPAAQLATPPTSSYSNTPPPQPSLFKAKALWGYNEHGQVSLNGLNESHDPV